MKMSTRAVSLIAVCFYTMSVAYAEQDPNMIRFEQYMGCAKQMIQVKPVDRAAEVQAVRGFAACIGNSDDEVLQKMSVCMGRLANKLEPYIRDANAINQQQISEEMQRCMQGINQ